MLLESLLECVNEIRERIDTHDAALRKSEAQTRYALIDPLLRELGWDTQDPALVVPEYQSGKVRADYALLSGGRPAMMVEAKSLDTPLGDVVRQGIGYCLEEGTPHFAVTDGRHWEVYETHRPVPIDDKRVVSFNLQGQSTAEVCLQALALWRPAVQSGHVAPGQATVVSLTPEEPVIPDTQRPPVVDEHEWQPLSGLNPEPGTTRPLEIRYPDDTRATLGPWWTMLAETIRWLSDKGKLREPVPARRRLIVNRSPVHSESRQMRRPAEVGGWFFSRNASAATIIDWTRRAIEHAGEDPSRFRVRFS